MTHPFAAHYPEHYQNSIDDETWAFIERTENFYPADTASRTIEEQRAVYTALCREFDTGLPATVTATDILVPANTAGESVDIPCRQYTRQSSAKMNQSCAIVYLHGGGFVVGGLDSHHSICADICDRTSLSVLSVDYRLSPEHLHPAAYDDACHCLQWACKNLTAKIILCGDSAGANLAAAASHRFRGQDCAPLGQVLVYPGLGGDSSKGSYQQHQLAPMLTLADIRFYESVRFDSSGRPDDPSASPLRDECFAGLPATVVISAECDPLCDDGMHYCNRINEAGGSAQFTMEPGLVHGFLRARNSVTRARNSFQRVVNSIRKLAEVQPT